MDSEDNKPKQGRWAKKRQARKTYRNTARTRLQEMFKAGKASKRSLDKTTGDTRDKIYSEQTYKTYKKQFGYFIDWVAKHTLKPSQSKTVTNTLMSIYNRWWIEKSLHIPLQPLRLQWRKFSAFRRRLL